MDMNLAKAGWRWHQRWMAAAHWDWWYRCGVCETTDMGHGKRPWPTCRKCGCSVTIHP
jgi:hypothetical protein